MDQMLREIASVLFVGHSLISPTLPTMMDDLLEAEVHYQIINGAPLESAWKDSRKAEGEDGRALLRKAPVDVLVLTERVPLDLATNPVPVRGELSASGAVIGRCTVTLAR